MMKDILIAMASVLVVGSASAQTPVNCDGLKNSLVPYEIRLKSKILGGIEEIQATQVFRDRSGAAIVWERNLSQRDLRSTTRSLQYNGFAIETETVRFIRASDGPANLGRIKRALDTRDSIRKHMIIRVTPSSNSSSFRM
jgi:hypothetical protein